MIARIGVLFLVATVGQAMQLPRPVPDLSIPLPQGGQVSLNQYRGKVVLLEFWLTTCPHCQAAARLASKLYSEYGSRGLQPLGAAYDEGAAQRIGQFIRDQGVKFPAGVLNRDVVVTFLQADPKQRIAAPQIVFVDRKGVIRQQTMQLVDPITRTEDNLRRTIEMLLKEPAPEPPKAAPAKPAPASKSKAARKKGS